MNLTSNYLSMPRALIRDLRDTPLALALYLLIARLYLVRQSPIPLSRGDIRHIDSTASTGAISRALSRLCGAGWLQETNGYKTGYQPTWGPQRGAPPRLWAMGAKTLGCPDHTWRTAVRIDRALLDVFVGKMQPHPRLALTIEGYCVDGDGQHHSLLTLREVGSYILLAAGYAAPHTAPLVRWGLMRDNVAQPIPQADAMLTLISQCVDGVQVRLSQAAWHALGWEARPQEDTASGTPLLFVPPNQIGHLTPRQHGCHAGLGLPSKAASTAFGQAETPLAAWAQIATGNRRKHREHEGTPPCPQAKPHGDGLHKKEAVGIPNSAACQQLQAFGVHSAQCLNELATIEPTTVTQAIGYAEAEQLGPGWVVDALRAHQDGRPLPTLRQHGQNQAISWNDLGAYQDVFVRSNATERPSAPFPLLPCVPDTPPQQMPAAPRAMKTAVLPDAAPPLSAAAQPPNDAAATDEIRARLLMQTHRNYHDLITSLTVRVAGAETVVHCASLDDRMTVVETMLGALRWLASDLGLPDRIRVTDAPPPPCAA